MRSILSLAILFCGTSLTHADDFAIKDGDRVVFLGDSITAARTYGKIIENYTLLRYPERKVRFFNAGWGGDTAAGGLKRLERDVFVFKPTVIIVAYGVNDIAWGFKADEEHKKAYLDGIRGIVEACLKNNIRVYICSAAITAEEPDKAEKGFLKKMCDEGMALSRSLGGNAIDIQPTMHRIQRRIIKANEGVQDKTKHDSLHTTDGVHLNDLGQLAMAFAILKGLSAPAEVSTVEIDAKEQKLIKANNAKVTALKATADAIEFIRDDEGLPFNYGIFFPLNYRFVPVPDELNRYMLKITGMETGLYSITVDDRGLGSFSAAQLAKGVNISSATADGWQPGGPWDAQANILKSLTESRHHTAIANLFSQIDLAGGKATSELKKQAEEFDDRIVTMQRTIAKPGSYRFVIRKTEKK